MKHLAGYATWLHRVNSDNENKKLNNILQLSAVILAMALCVSTANAKHHGEGEDLLADLKDCKADSATISPS